MARQRCVYDTEANGFLRSADRWFCGGIIDLDTKEEKWYGPLEFEKFLRDLCTYDVRAAHNGAGYDEYLLIKLARLNGITWYKHDHDKFVDTHVMSRVLNYDRFDASDRNYQNYLKWRNEQGDFGLSKKPKLVMGDSHSLARWGIHLDNYKGEWTDFTKFSKEMFEYMKQDVRLMVPIYKELLGEVTHIVESGQKNIVRAIQIETDSARIAAEQLINGWLIDRRSVCDVIDKIDKRMDEITSEVNPRLGKEPQKISGDRKGYKSDTIRYTDEYDHDNFTGGFAKKWAVQKNGLFSKALRETFDLPEDAGKKNNYGVWGDYCRVTFRDADIGSTDSVKRYLWKIGWEPDDWNGKWEFDERGKRYWKRTSPKITSTSLELLDNAGDINEFYTLRSRKSIMDGWEDHFSDNDRLHGDVINIGTPTFRQTQSVIVNLPSGNATLGKEVRSLFIAEEGWSVVSADSAGCQLRLLAHYMKDDEFLKELLEGDMHQNNANILSRSATSILKSSTIVSRADAKPFIFAFLYGAGGPKLAKILKLPESVGFQLKEEFQKAYPNLDSLINRVKKIVKKQGFIVGLDDRHIYCNQPHKALNYLIQGAEAIVMKATISMIWRRFKEEGIAHRFLLFYHDEINIEVRNDYVERAKEIIIESFKEAPKEFGVDIMVCGDCKAGKDYFEVH